MTLNLKIGMMIMKQNPFMLNSLYRKRATLDIHLLVLWTKQIQEMLGR
jgi:hypothetical protein